MLNITEKNNSIIVKDFGYLDDFSLADTLDCGQCFRFNLEENGLYYGVIRDKIICVSQNEHELIFHNIELNTFKNIIISYFDLERDYKKIKNDFCKDPILKKAVEFSPGIRILKQDTWETLCSFIVSQNNDIKRVKIIIKRLCENFGEPIDENSTYYTFPTPEKLANLTINDLLPLKSGFRAKYIIDAAKKVVDGLIVLDDLKNMPIDSARKLLCTIYGVGPKVAECVLLYGVNKLEAFPMDVWMKRAMSSLFPNGLPENAVEYGGIAQQFIFHYVRNDPNALK